MTAIATSHLTLQCEPSLASRYATLRDFIADRVDKQRKPAKTIAMDMGMSPSTLSRKLKPAESDTQRFNVDDLESYMEETGDFAAIEYLAAKFLNSDEARKARAIKQVEELATDLFRVLAELKGTA